MQDNVIDATPYFLEDNKVQALGERRVGLGVMGLADLLIYCEKVYGSEEGNELVDKVFETIATTAYRESIELAKEKGSFPFLIGKTDEETKALRNAFINTGFMKKMPEDIRESILRTRYSKLPSSNSCSNRIHWNNGWRFHWIRTLFLLYVLP